MYASIQMAECGQMHHCRQGEVWQGHLDSQHGAAAECWLGGPQSVDQHYQQKSKADKRMSKLTSSHNNI